MKVQIMHDPIISNSELRAIESGIKKVKSIVDITQNIEIENVGVWKYVDHCNPDGSLRPNMSVDWYLSEAAKSSLSDGRINSGNIIFNLERSPYFESSYYYIFATSHEIYRVGYPILIGDAGNNVAVVSSFWFSQSRILSALEDNRSLEKDIINAICENHNGLMTPNEIDLIVNACIETATIHEFGHLLGLPGEENRKNVIKVLGNHCTNICSMQQGIHLPEDWISISAQRLCNNTYCEDCMTLLKAMYS